MNSNSYRVTFKENQKFGGVGAQCVVPKSRKYIPVSTGLTGEDYRNGHSKISFQRQANMVV